ncbi:patatin-like phospholipase family protein [Flavobacterium sp. RSB2_4_14]|uniref:patatin-like phospholipase family protein n=1 Tax=Flavobacterium sp. RSB2_4_14 TaxID=3447665 RepID=UPI003F407C77
MKKNIPLLLFLSFFFFITQLNFAQEKKPKVVLVLSGGGAKGVAHIPLLQALDSLHIVPDLIVGNSMGSVMGGLYAMGYSGDSIAKLIKVAEWDKLLGGAISLEKVSVEEKSEFGRYLVGLDIKNGKPKPVSSLLSDQNLRQYLSELTHPVYKIKDFDQLPIPFRALATDLVTGQEVVIDKGNLATAIRASMSLPAVFNAVPFDGTLLVDGGVVNNFPTDIAKKLGADIIIGSDVGGGMEPIDKLDNFVSVLVQTSMLVSNVKNPEKRELCDILVDHLPNLTYSTGDFDKSNIIYEEGKIATKENIKKLASLAEKLKGFKQRTHELPKTDKEFALDTIIFKNVSKDNLDLVMARTNIKEETKYTTNDIAQGIDRAMGTNLFSRINQYTSNDGDKIRLELDCQEHSKNQVNASLHYDTYRGVGMILNYTARNVFGKSSRMLLTADIAEQPRMRIDYQKIFGKNKDWWFGSEMYGEKLIQAFFIDGNLAEDMKYDSFQFNNQINKNINSMKSYMGIGLNYQYTYLRPKTNPEVSENLFLINSYYFNNIELNVHYSYNDLNKVFFATTGSILQATVSRSLLHDIDYNFAEVSTQSINGETNGFTKLNVNCEKRHPINKKISALFGATTAFIFDDPLKSGQVSFSEYGYAAKYFLGGTVLNPGNNSYLFAGIYDDELNVSQIMKLNLGVQTNPFGSIFITPHFDIASIGYGPFNEYIKDAFSPRGDWQDRTKTSLLLSGGGTLAYNSILGPITFDASWVNDINKVRLFFSIGFVFNPAD